MDVFFTSGGVTKNTVLFKKKPFIGNNLTCQECFFRTSAKLRTGIVTPHQFEKAERTNRILENLSRELTFPDRILHQSDTNYGKAEERFRVHSQPSLRDLSVHF